MAEFQFAGFIANLIHGEVHDPAEGVLLLVHVAGNGCAQRLDQHTGGLLRRAQRTGRERHEVVGLQVQSGNHLLLDRLDELGNAADDLTVFVQTEPVRLAAGDDLHIGQRFVNEFPGLVEIADHHGLDLIALKGAEAAAAQHVGDVLHRQVNPQIRLVGAVLLHGLQIGNTDKGGFAGPVVGAVFGEDGGQNLFTDGEHVLLRGKSHLHIQLIELAGRTVAAGVLVPEAGGNLEIAVKAGGHQQLLELLGRLRQRIEFAGMLPGRHQIVTGAFRGGGGQDGGGDFHEALGGSRARSWPDAERPPRCSAE